LSRYLTYSTRAIPGARRVDDGAGVDFGSREEPSRALCDQHGDGQGIGATTGRVSGGRTGTVRACPPARCMCCGRLRAGGRVQSRQQRYGPGREAGSGAAPRRKYNRDLPMCERTRGLPTSAWPLTRRLGPAADRGARARAAPPASWSSCVAAVAVRRQPPRRGYDDGVRSYDDGARRRARASRSRALAAADDGR
jgi:hypothetical protein